MEFISYEVKPGKPLPGIEPHVDNASVITMVAMMADRKGYTGGVSCFERGRRLRLERGDVVFFRGELCEHWIEPVETGFRAILQIEMCRYLPNWTMRSGSESRGAGGFGPISRLGGSQKPSKETPSQVVFGTSSGLCLY